MMVDGWRMDPCVFGQMDVWLNGLLDGCLMEGWMHKLLDGGRVGCPPSPAMKQTLHRPE